MAEHQREIEAAFGRERTEELMRALEELAGVLP